MIKKLFNINLDFSDFQRSSNAKLHWYPASFIPQIPNLLLSHLCKPSQTVLDPYSGSGSTIQEANKLGMKSIGMDYNPIAFLLNKVITTYYDLTNLKDFCDSANNSISATKSEIVPNFNNKELWYHPETLKELGRIKYFISNLKTGKLKYFHELAFSSILKHCSTQKDHYTYVADNMFPKEIDDRYYVSAKLAYVKRLFSNYYFLRDYYESIQRAGFDPKEQLKKSKFLLHDIRKPWSKINDNVDIILTSPPYAGVTDYTRGQRLSFYWFPEWDINEYFKSEIGARGKRSRKIFYDEYLNDMHEFTLEAKHVLKNKGLFVLVIGQTSSIKRKSDLISRIKEITTNIGFKLISDELKRNIKYKQIGIVEGVKKESILIFKKN